jgi:tetratricopeptide (TPR) repeat protein
LTGGGTGTIGSPPGAPRWPPRTGWPHPPAQARAHRILADAYTRLGRVDDAHTQLNHALDLATQSGDHTVQAHIHFGLCYLWERQDNYPLALDHARQSLDLCRAAGHQLGQAEALNQIGWYRALLGEHQQALTSCQQALTLHQDLDNRAGQARTVTEQVTKSVTAGCHTLCSLAGVSRATRCGGCQPPGSSLC